MKQNMIQRLCPKRLCPENEVGDPITQLEADALKARRAYWTIFEKMVEQLTKNDLLVYVAVAGAGKSSFLRCTWGCVKKEDEEGKAQIGPQDTASASRDKDGESQHEKAGQEGKAQTQEQDNSRGHRDIDIEIEIWELQRPLPPSREIFHWLRKRAKPEYFIKVHEKTGKLDVDKLVEGLTKDVERWTEDDKNRLLNLLMKLSGRKIVIIDEFHRIVAHRKYVRDSVWKKVGEFLNNAKDNAKVILASDFQILDISLSNKTSPDDYMEFTLFIDWHDKLGKHDEQDRTGTSVVPTVMRHGALWLETKDGVCGDLWLTSSDFPKEDIDSVPERIGSSIRFLTLAPPGEGKWVLASPALASKCMDLRNAKDLGCKSNDLGCKSKDLGCKTKRWGWRRTQAMWFRPLPQILFGETYVPIVYDSIMDQVKQGANSPSELCELLHDELKGLSISTYNKRLQFNRIWCLYRAIVEGWTPRLIREWRPIIWEFSSENTREKLFNFLVPIILLVGMILPNTRVLSSMSWKNIIPLLSSLLWTIWWLAMFHTLENEIPLTARENEIGKIPLRTYVEVLTLALFIVYILMFLGFFELGVSVLIGGPLSILAVSLLISVLHAYLGSILRILPKKSVVVAKWYSPVILLFTSGFLWFPDTLSSIVGNSCYVYCTTAIMSFYIWWRQGMHRISLKYVLKSLYIWVWNINVCGSPREKARKTESGK